MRLTIPNRGGSTRGAAMMKFSWWLAIGTGDEAWGETPPSVPLDAEGINAPLGFLRERERSFVLPSPDGELVTEGGLAWTHSLEPTRFLYVRFVLDFREAQPSRLRELAIYLDAEPKPEVPAGQNFVPVEDMLDNGHLYGLERFAVVIRDGSQRQTWQTILQF